MNTVRMISRPQSASLANTGLLETAQQPALVLAAIGMLGLGILGLTYGDFASVWQPVAAWIPGRTALAYIVAALECATAVGMLFSSTSRWAVRVLFPGVILWQLLRVPEVFLGARHVGAYLGWGETALLLAGGWTLFARLSDLSPESALAFLQSERSLRLARMYLGLCIIPIGLSHIVYIEPTIRLIPTWLPNRAFFAWLTGLGQIASGLGLLFNVLPRFAAWAEAAQLWTYTLLIWIPCVLFGPNPGLQAVFGAGNTRTPWTGLLVTWLPAACAMAVAQNVPDQRKSVPEN